MNLLDDIRVLRLIDKMMDQCYKISYLKCRSGKVRYALLRRIVAWHELGKGVPRSHIPHTNNLDS